MTAELWALVLALPLGQIATMALSTVVPAMRDDLRLTYVELGAVLAGFGLARVIVDLPAGEVVRRANPRTVLLWSLAGGLASSLVGLLATSAWQVAVSRVIVGATSATAQAVVLAWLVGGSAPQLRGRVLALSEALFSTFFLAVPSATGILASATPFGWRIAFVIGTLGGVLSLVVVAVGTSGASGARAMGHGNPSANEAGWGALQAGGRVLAGAYLATVVVFYGRHSLLSTLLPVIGADQVGLAPLSIGLALTALSAVSIGALLFGGWLGDRVGRQRMLLPGVALLAVCQAGLLLISGAPSYVLVTAVQGIGFLVNSLPIGLVGDALPTVGRSRGIALYRLLGDSTILVSPLAIGLALDLGGFQAGKAAILVPTLGILVVLVALRLWPERQTPATAAGLPGARRGA